MSQFGMQMPGAVKAKPPLNIYTGLLLLAVIALGLATAYVYRQASLVAPEEGPQGVITLQEQGAVNLPNADQAS